MFCSPFAHTRFVAAKRIATFSVALVTVAACVAFTACGGSPHTGAFASNPGAAGLNISASLPTATVGSGYQGSVQATGGTAPYKFSVSSGNLPQGLQLSAINGAISGTPSSAGAFNFAVSVSDSRGVSQQKALQISVSNNSSSGGGSGSGNGGGSSSGKSFSNVQKAGGWSQAGQGPPKFTDCSPSPCDGVSFSMSQGISSPSLSGSATEFNIGGNVPYMDAIWHNDLIGPFSSQGTFDNNGSLVPSLHSFTYDVDFYTDNLGASEALEFDVNQFFGGMGFIWGHQCRIDNGNGWDVFDNQKGAWVSTGVPCYPKNNAWNHLTIKVQRTSDNHLVYQSITLNGQTANLNWSLPHGSAPGWYGVTINYQMDGNFRQDSYHVYLDNLTITYE